MGTTNERADGVGDVDAVTTAPTDGHAGLPVAPSPMAVWSSDDHRLVTTAVPASFEDRYVGLFVLAQRGAARILGDRAAAEDVAAETMARAFANWSKVNSYADAWVTRVALNLAIDLLRRKPALFAGHAQMEDGGVDRLVLREHLAALPRRQREVIVTRYLLGFDERETASMLGVSVGTVHTHAKRGLARLRDALADTTDGAEHR